MAPFSANRVATSEYSAVVLSSAKELARLKDVAGPLLAHPDICREPGFFLASITPAWLPRVVVVRRGETVVGIVYAKERRIAGVPIGIIYADGTFGNLAIADPENQEEVLGAAIRRLLELPFIRGVRLVIPSEGATQQHLTNILCGMPVEVCYSRADSHSRLPLPGGYQDFLQCLGYKTRRNFRYYRRRFKAAGHAYLESLSQEELDLAARQLMNKCRIPTEPDALERALKIVAAVDKPLCVGLRHRNGQWMAVAGGWYSDDRVTMIFQLNDDLEYERESLSVVLRAYLVEMLIRQGIGELVFWAGTAPPLSRYVSKIPTIGVYLDMPTFAWRAARCLFSRVCRWLPRRLAEDADWIVPATHRRTRTERASSSSRLPSNLAIDCGSTMREEWP